MTDLHYRLTDETKTLHNGKVLYRIQATHDLPRHGVKAGDLGGWVEGTHNLFTGTPEQNFGPWIADEAIVTDKAIVWGHALIAGEAVIAVEANVSGYARVDGRARVAGYAIISRNAHVTDQARVLDHAQVTNDAIVYGDAFIAGSVTIMDNAMVGGSARLSPGIHAITGHALIESAVDVLTFMPAISGMGMDYITLTKTPQMAPHVHTTGFDGSLDEFEEAVRDGKKYFYFSTKDKAIQDELLAVCDAFRARVKRWNS